MSLSTEEHDMLEVSVVNVGVNSEQALEYDLYNVLKVLGEWYSQLAGEDLLVVKLIFNPRHQEVNVLACAYFQRSLYVMPVSP